MIDWAYATGHHADVRPSIKDRRLESETTCQASLPSWPLTLVLSAMPIWWVLGIIDFIWIPAAGIMFAYMARRGGIFVPRGFGIWLLLLAFAGCSVIGLSQPIQFLGFGYRLANYAACTIVFVYVLNAREHLKDRFLVGLLSIWWLVVVAGGYLATLFPTAVFRTPVSLVMPDALLGNAWVRLMVIRPFNQYNPDSFFQLDPRPSAPFIYTNQWGSVYSLLIPMVIAYLIHVRGSRRFVYVLVALIASFVPAILTTNRGMLLGLVVGATYAAMRAMLRRDFRGIAALAVIAGIGAAIFQMLPVSDRLEARIAAPSIVDRAWLYLQSVEAVKESPLFGYGRTLTVAGSVDPVGTQGEFWIVLVSYGVIAAMLLLCWFMLAFIQSTGRTDTVGLAASTVLIVALVELFYYGAVPYSLPIVMIASAIAFRSPSAAGAHRGDELSTLRSNTT